MLQSIKRFGVLLLVILSIFAITTTALAEIMYVNANPTLNVRSGMGKNYPVVATLKNGTAVEVLERYASGWSEIKISGRRGYYVMTKYLKNKVPKADPDQAAADDRYGDLGYGSTGSKVRKLQQDLQNLGYSINVDGTFKNETQKIVRRFQQDNNLKVDGIVGPETRLKLYKKIMKR